MCQGVEGGVDSQSGCDQVDKWGFVADFSIAEEFGAGNVSATAVGFNALPVVGAL